MPVLLDTDVAIELLRGNAFTRECLAQCTEEIYISAITAAELYYGAFHSRRAAENVSVVDRLLAQFPRLNFTDTSAKVFGETKEQLRMSGKTVDVLDLMIASIALAAGCKVVTGNIRHYVKVPGLLLEDWIREDQASRDR